MSSRIRAYIPLQINSFIFLDDCEILLETLDHIGMKYRVEGSVIVLDSHNYFYETTLKKSGDGYILKGDSDLIGVTFQEKLIKEYKKVYQNKVRNNIELKKKRYSKRLEEEKRKEEKRKREEQEKIRLRTERKKIEQKRQRIIEKKKNEIYKRAEKMGYSIKEEVKQGKIKIQLVKRVY